MTRRTIHLTATADQHRILTDFLRGFCELTGVPGAARFALELALEELFVNTSTHGADSAGRAPNVVVTLDYDSPEIRAIFEDDGPAFDPLSVTSPALDAPLEARPTGGLGIHLLKDFADHVDYEYAAGRNRVSLRVGLRA